MICAAFLWFNDLCLPGGGPRWNLGSAAPLEWLVFYVWRRKMRAHLGNKEKQRVSRWCTFKELNDSRRKYDSMSVTKSSVAPAVIVHHCATETEGKAKTADATLPNVSTWFCFLYVYVTDHIRWQKPTNASWNQQFSQEQQKVRHLIQHSHPTAQRQRIREGFRHKLCLKKKKISQIQPAIYRITFLIKRKKASLEEVQKFFPYIAIC